MTITAITNARIVGPAGIVLIEGDTIAATGLTSVPDGATVIDAKGAWLAPGIVDLGVFAVDRAACTVSMGA